MKALKEREHKVIYKDGDKVVKVFEMCIRDRCRYGKNHFYF